jgi:hypothetical protein
MPDEVANIDALSDEQKDSVVQLAELAQEAIELGRQLQNIRAQRLALSEEERRVTLRVNEIGVLRSNISLTRNLREQIENDHRVKSEKNEKLRKLERFAESGTIEKEEK